MNLFSKNKLYKSDIYDQIPVPKNGELFAVPMSNALWHPRTAVTTSRTALPEWYRDIEKDISMGLRHCSGLIDYLRTGYSLPLWGHLDVRPPLSMGDRRWDVRFDMRDTKAWETENLSMDDTSNWPHYMKPEVLMSSQFGENQTGGGCPIAKIKKRKNSTYVKLSNPWLFRTAPGWSSLILPHVWDINADYRILSGVVHTDYYHHANIVIDIIADRPFSISEGTRMAHIVPFKRKDLLKNTQVLRGDENTWKLLNELGFNGVYTTTDHDGKYKREQHGVDKLLEESGDE